MELAPIHINFPVEIYFKFPKEFIHYEIMFGSLDQIIRSVEELAPTYLKIIHLVLIICTYSD